ncbi:MAG: hypothetical protein ACTSUE_11100 [Promethearchaeota archaeon]
MGYVAVLVICVEVFHSWRDAVFFGVFGGIMLAVIALVNFKLDSWVYTMGRPESKIETKVLPQNMQEVDELRNQGLTVNVASKYRHEIEDPLEIANDSDNVYCCYGVCSCLTFILIIASSVLPWFAASDNSPDWALSIRESPCFQSSCYSNLQVLDLENPVEPTGQIFNPAGWFYDPPTPDKGRVVRKWKDWNKQGDGFGLPTSSDFPIICPYEKCHWAHSNTGNSECQIRIQGYESIKDGVGGDTLKVDMTQPCKPTDPASTCIGDAFDNTECQQLASVDTGFSDPDSNPDYPNPGVGIFEHCDGCIDPDFTGKLTSDEMVCHGNVEARMWTDTKDELNQNKMGAGRNVCPLCVGWFRDQQEKNPDFGYVEPPFMSVDCPDDLYKDLNVRDLDFTCGFFCPGAQGPVYLIGRDNSEEYPNGYAAEHRTGDMMIWKTYMFWIVGFYILLMFLLTYCVMRCCIKKPTPLADKRPYADIYGNEKQGNSSNNNGTLTQNSSLTMS